jgi:hypothetical protein
MKVARKVAEKVSILPEGSTFGYEDFALAPEEYLPGAKAIERLLAKGIIRRVSKGVFYKPKTTIFGELKPREEELLKPYLFDGGKRIAYITGLSLYNRMGLTTQVPHHIQIASRDKRIVASVGPVKATPVKSYADVTEDNYRLLELLDALKDFKGIPDLDKQAALTLLQDRLRLLLGTDYTQLVHYALLYPPRVRALLGALLENLGDKVDLQPLKRSLNPLTGINYGISPDDLSTAPSWSIK